MDNTYYKIIYNAGLIKDTDLIKAVELKQISIESFEVITGKAYYLNDK